MKRSTVEVGWRELIAAMVGEESSQVVGLHGTAEP